MNRRRHRQMYFPRNARRWRSPYGSTGEGYAFLGGLAVLLILYCLWALSIVE